MSTTKTASKSSRSKSRWKPKYIHMYRVSERGNKTVYLEGNAEMHIRIHREIDMIE